jgi:hypothetical protein
MAKAGGKAGRQAEADGHRLPMEKRAVIAALGLERVGEGMAEIEQGAA